MMNVLDFLSTIKSMLTFRFLPSWSSHMRNNYTTLSFSIRSLEHNLAWSQECLSTMPDRCGQPGQGATLLRKENQTS